MSPQRRMVLGLVAMSGAAFVLTVVGPKKPIEKAQQDEDLGLAPGPPAGPLTPPRLRGATVDLPPPDGLQAQQAEDVGAAMGVVIPAVNRCAQDRVADFAPLDGGLQLRLDLGPGGLASAAVLDLGALSAPATDCLARAVWGVGFPATEPAESVTFTFYVVAPLGPTDAPDPP